MEIRLFNYCTAGFGYKRALRNIVYLVCCLSECKGQIIISRPFRTDSAEQLKNIYEATKKYFSEDFEDDESIFEDEED